MPRATRCEEPDGHFDSSSAPRDVVRREFARRLYAAMVDKGWNQSELGRQADIGRDNISGYINEKTLPGPVHLRRLAKALDMQPHELLPPSERPRSEAPAFAMRQSLEGADKVFLQVNQHVSQETALKIHGLIREDHAAHQS